MAEKPKSVLLFAAKEKKTSFSKLEESNFHVTFQQVLDFKVLDSTELMRKLFNPFAYEGIIFTSPRAIQAVSNCICNSIVHDAWGDKVHNFVVGDSTYILVRSELGFDCRGKHTGNASNLADFIIRGRAKYSKPFLFPCGNMALDTLTTKLSDHDIEVDSVLAYETVKHERLERDIAAFLGPLAPVPEFLVFFSPSGVNFVMETFKSLKYFDRLHKHKVIAFGPSSAEAVKKFGVNVHAVCPYPSEDGLLEALNK